MRNPSLFRQARLIRSYSGMPSGETGTVMQRTRDGYTFVRHQSDVNMNQEKLAVLFHGKILSVPTSELILLK